MSLCSSLCSSTVTEFVVLVIFVIISGVGVVVIVLGGSDAPLLCSGSIL